MTDLAQRALRAKILMLVRKLMKTIGYALITTNFKSTYEFDIYMMINELLYCNIKLSTTIQVLL